MIDTKLLAAIRQRPDDDAPRTVYADWLEEQGELSRANLIRLQCRLAELPAWEREAAAARRDIAQLLCDHGDRWRAELPVLAGVAWTTFRRGFVDAIRVDTVDTLYRHAAAIAEAAPVTRVEVETFDETIDAAEPVPLPWLRALRVTWQWNTFRIRTTDSLIGKPAELEIVAGENTVIDMLAAREGAPLERLAILGRHTVATAVVDRIVGLEDSRRTLRRLELGTRFVDHDSGYFEDPTLRGPGAERLAAARFDRVEVLDVSRQRVADDGLGTLLGSLPRLAELAARGSELGPLFWLPRDHGAAIVRLDLGENPIGDAGAREIATAPRTAKLASLALDVCEVSGAGITALVEAPLWHELRELDLSGNPLGIDGVLALTTAPRPQHLHALRLADVDLDDEAVRLLATTEWLDQLVTVDLSRNRVTAELLDALTGVRDLRLAGCGELPEPTTRALRAIWRRAWRVDVRGTAVTPAALPDEAPELYRLELGSIDAALIRRLGHGRFPALRRLELGGTRLASDARVAPDAIDALLGSPVSDQLVALGLASCGLTDAALRHIADNPFARLGVLDLSRNDCDPGTLTYLANSATLRRVPVVIIAGMAWPSANAARQALGKRFGTGWYNQSRADLDPEHDEAALGPRGDDDDDE
jgi:uncharacterized protein (TIGR02996 family)